MGTYRGSGFGSGLSYLIGERKVEQPEEAILVIDKKSDLTILIEAHGICKSGLCDLNCKDCKVIYCG